MMANDDTWRGRLAAERFGDSLTPGFARDRRSDTVPPDVAPMKLPPRTPLLAGAPRTPGSAYRAAPRAARRRLPLWSLVAAVVAVIVATAIGWFAGDRGRRVPVAVAVPAVRAAPVPPPAAAPAATAPAAPLPRPVDILPTPPVDAVPAAPVVAAVPDPATEPGGVRHRGDHASARSAAPDRAPAAAPRSDRLHHATAPTETPRAARRTAAGPSFECRRPVSEVTRTICGDRQLAALDRQLAARFALLDSSVDPATIEALHHGETSFLNARQSCPDKACLTDAYHQRLRELNNIEP